MRPKRLYNSFANSWHGLVTALRNEQNLLLELTAAVIVFVLAALLKVSALEWVALIIISTVVVVLELINTALEYLLDLVKPRLNSHVLRAKDVAAAAVGLSALAAVSIGIIIFYPHFQTLLK